tara:strand:- start:589 stop:1371 length:783 start_codon:yes stop_codon:yes gene_type:complete
MSFTGKTKASTYKDILQMNNSNSGVDTTTRNVVDGEGTASSISISDDVLTVKPQNDDTTALFNVQDSDSNNLLVVDSTNDLIKAGLTQTAVNTQIQHFGFSSNALLPTNTNWQGVPSFAQETQSRLEMGSGSTPDSSLTISLNGDDLVGHIFYVPVNLTIDSCSVWVGADASSGDTLQFSVMSYDIDTSNSATGGDLSNGAEHCVSPSTITSAGYEQSYFQQLTVSTANVDAGKVIMAFIKSDGTNSDYSVNMNLVYHIR